MWESLKRFFRAREPKTLARWKISIDGYGKFYVSKNVDEWAFVTMSGALETMEQAESWIRGYELGEKLQKRKLVKYV